MYCNVASTLTILQHGSLVRLLNPISTSQESFPLTSTAFGMVCSLPSQTSLPSWVAYTTVLSWATLNLLAAVCFAGLFFSILPLDIQPSKGLSLAPWVMLTSKIKKFHYHIYLMILKYVSPAPIDHLDATLVFPTAYETLLPRHFVGISSSTC